MKRKLLLLLLSLLSMVANAYDAEFDGIYYNLSGDEATVTYRDDNYNSYSGTVVIPSSFTYTIYKDDGTIASNKTYQVTSIGEHAFYGCSALTSITIPSSVTSIGYYAFSYCSGLKSIEVEEGNTKYDSRDECNAIIETSSNKLIAGCQYTIIPESVTSIGSLSFYGCSNLESIIIPDRVTTIGNYAFNNCSNMTTLTIGRGLTTVEQCPFLGCNNLSSVTFHCKEIGKSWLVNVAEYIKEVIIGDEVMSIGDYAFWNCNNMASVTIGSSVMSIGDVAFYNCSSLTSINIPNSVTRIGRNAFSDCSSLTSVTIGSGVTSVGQEAFSNCSSLQKVIAPDIAAWCGITFGSYLANPLVCTHHIFIDEETEITDLVIPEGVTGIGSYAFEYCYGLTSVTIPNSVTYIADGAFLWCKGLNSITIGNGVTNIGERVFDFCYGLTSVTMDSDAIVSASGTYTTSMKSIFGDHVQTYVIGNSVTCIGDYAFSDCKALTSITIPESVRSIGEDAFYSCSNLLAVKITDLAAWCNISFKNYSSQPLKYAHNLYLNGDLITDLIIPSSVTSIGDYAFCNCSGLTSVTIPQYVTFIGKDAFYSCSGLTSITIPNSVTSIGDYAFQGCNGLTSVTIPDGVTFIGYDAFKGCSNLNEVLVHVTDYSLFCENTVMGLIDNKIRKPVKLIDDEGEEITEYFIPDGVTSIGKNSFKKCNGLKFIYIPSSVTSIGDWAFYGCSGLTTVFLNSNAIVSASRWPSTSMKSIFGEQVRKYVIGNSIKRIGDYAFCDCSSMTSVNIPNSVTSIGSNAFSGCSGLLAIDITDLTAWCNISFKDYSSQPLSQAHNLYLNGLLITDLIIPSSVTTISNYAFAGCSNLTSINIPNSVMMIGEGAFKDCNNLISVTLKSNAFVSASRWPSTSMESIFGKQVKKYVIGSSIKKIGDYAFCGCNGMTSVNIPDNVTSIGEGAFMGCYGLTSINIPNSVTSIGGGAFSGCSGLTSINIPNSVVSIGDYAFDYCSGLTSVTIPNSVTSIDKEAFFNCNNLTFVKVENALPAEIYDNTFTNRSNAVLLVPAGSIASYQAADYWRDFKKIVDYIAEGDVNVDDGIDVLDVVDIARFVVGNPATILSGKSSDDT